ncbi:putative farnesyl pyrophosphate synthase [Trypanosoma cruzi]|uniref:Putative farnesyl pyrophosphate synthase n=1 Tax=Trypanosoma cruzi TaxID=5693 RepID=A0A2V2UNA3_TRYCR|nr:putative farnesyl pyrophosphate synthase [Trypanosoma cruzi]
MIEFLQAHYLVEDDIMDGSVMRRGKPCWYRFPGVTTQCAINDGIILKSWTQIMAWHYFADRPFLKDLLCLFQKVDYATAIGQMYDVTSMCDSNKLDPEVAQPDDYRLRRIYAGHLQAHSEVQDNLLHVPAATRNGTFSKRGSRLRRDEFGGASGTHLIGEYFQVQDDVMDCFTPPEQLGKVGTDIEDAKCSWLAVTFLGKANAAQVAEFKANYGEKDPAKVAVVKRLYSKANLQADFAAYEAEVVREVESLIEQLKVKSPTFAESVAVVWEKTHKRKK